MSKFDQAAAKAKAAAPVPKVAAKAGAAAPPAKAGAAAPLPKPPAAVAFKTLDDRKRFVRAHEIKIDDLQTECEGESNRATKKDLETKLKKLQQDATYVQAKEEVKDMEAQSAKDAERAQVTATASKKNDSGEKSMGKSKSEVARGEKADAAIMAEVDAALASTAKDANAKADAVAKLEAYATHTPYVLHRVEKLVALFADSKLGAPAVKAACKIVECCKPDGHGIAAVIVPALLAGMEAKTWKTKAACIQVLTPCLHEMGLHTPAQLAMVLPLIVPKLAEAALEVRAEIRTATGAVLREIGALVESPEIKLLSQELVTALAEPTNQKHTQAVLAKMGNQTFLSLIDPASLSLLMPVVVRGLKERDSTSKKWSAQIFGSTSILVRDVDSMKPYLKSIIPMLQDALHDPVSEVVREAAKAFGVLEAVLPDYSRLYLQPWLFKHLREGDIGLQLGCALAVAEVLLKMDKTKQPELIAEIQVWAMEEKAQTRRGFLELLEAVPHAMKMDFVPYIKRLFPVMLMGINGDKEKDDDAGLKASTSLVMRFGDLCPDLLLPGFESVYAATLHSASSEESNRQQIIRDKVVMLLGKLVEKVLEHKKFGQDLLSTDECSTKDVREAILTLVFLTRFDGDPSVKRYANGAWKAAGGAPKPQKQITPRLEKTLLRMRCGDLGLGAQKHAAKVYEELTKAGELEAPAGDEPAAAGRFIIGLPEDRATDGVAASIASGKVPESTDAEFTRASSGSWGGAEDVFVSHPVMEAEPEEMRIFCGIVAMSIITEGRKKKVAGKKIVEQIVEALTTLLDSHHELSDAIKNELPAIAEEAARASLGDVFDATHKGGAADEEMLLYVESLLLMYGAGHLLLKDTTLEMKKNHRYGVVGQNGAGKTTLMKEIADHRLVGMPKDLKCVHVDDSKLGLMTKSCLTSLEYCIKMAKDIGVDNAGKETLLAVGFPEKMLQEPVSDLSTGWRMRLTLAVSMCKHADLVLLDEPTNHLDEQSVEWLGDYINSIHNSSVMVISHEPKFLNKVCTDIMAYVDKKLEYTDGDFTHFAAKKGLSKDQIDAMLSGNLSFDTKKPGDEDGEEGEEAKVAGPVSGPPKLSFPIPGTMDGVKSGSKAVLEANHVYFRYSEDKEYLIKDANLKLSLNARIAICGRNGCGKSTLMTLLCSETSPSIRDGVFGEVSRHCNLRMAYMKQDHLKALGPFFDTSPFVYITERFKDGWDGDLQRRLIDPEDEEEGERRKRLAKEHGKYGNEVEDLVSRAKVGNELCYEVKWKGLDDGKQNTIEKISKLKMMGLDKVIIACDERIAAKAAGLDQRPLTRREVVRHVEAFGIDEEMCCNRQIRGFSAGQKVRLSLAAMFWTKPHLIALDEPTNYLDVETVEALAKALNSFRGGIVMIEPKTDFVERICNEKWHLEDGVITVEKLKNGAKRMA